MRIACVIPARFGSTRFPGKLLAKAHGKTVLQRTFESASEHFAPEQLFVATDDARIAEHIEGLGGQVVWTSESCPNGTERIAEALRSTQSLADADIVVNLQGDHPCIRAASLKAAVDALRADPVAVMSTIATSIRHLADFLSPHVVKVVVDRAGNALYFSRAPIPYTREGLPAGALHHIGLYAFRTEFLARYAAMASTPLQLLEDLEQLKVLEMGLRIKVAVVEETPIAVDTPQDLQHLENYLCQLSTSS